MITRIYVITGRRVSLCPDCVEADNHGRALSAPALSSGEGRDCEGTEHERAVQLGTIRRRAYNDVAREIAGSGIVLDHSEADSLGEEALDWLRTRLGLRVTETDTGVVAETESQPCPRCGGPMRQCKTGDEGCYHCNTLECGGMITP